MKRRLAAGLAVLALAGGLAACSDADTVSHNLSKDADNFKIYRQIIFYNGITGTYMAEVDGYCSIGNDSTSREVNYTCKIGQNKYIKNSLGLSDNVTYMSLQADPVNVSKNHYKMVLKPETIIPGIEVR